MKVTTQSVKLEQQRAQAKTRWDFEQGFRQGVNVFAGVDEAGRGALAGPVVAAAVILGGAWQDWLGIDDSKRLSKRRREQLADTIRQNALGVGIGIASVQEIDTLNILHASRLAMGRAVLQLYTPPELVLVDGTYNPIYEQADIKSIAIVEGDGKCLSIAAASIVAKVARDQIMADLAVQYPDFGFDKHVGYGTKEHLQALIEVGPCAVHRLTFAPVLRSRERRVTLL